MAEDIASLGYDIDSTQALGAAKNLLKMESAAGRAAASSANLETTFRSANGQFRRATEHARDHASEIRSLAMQYNTALSAELKFADAQRDVARAVKLGVISADQQDAVLERLQAQYLATGKAAATMGRGLQASSMHSTNLLFQFQDIGMMLAAGQNPLMLAMQQGTQVAGVFHQMKTSGQSAFSGIKAGLLGLVSPTSLLTIGVIAGGAALAQWGIAALTSGEKTKEASEYVDDFVASLDQYNDIVKRSQSSTVDLRKEFGDFADEMKLLSGFLAEVAVSRAMDNFTVEAFEATSAIKDAANSYRDFLDVQRITSTETSLSLREQNEIIGEFEKEAKQAAEALGLMPEQADMLDRAFSDLAASKDVFGIRDNAREVLDVLEQLYPSIDDMPGSLKTSALNLEQIVGAAARAVANMSAMTAEARATEDAILRMGSVRPRMRPMDLGDPDPGRGGGGASRENARKREMEAFIQSLMTEREQLEAWHVEQLDLLAQYNDAELAAIGGHNEAKIRLEQEYQSRLNEIRQSDRDRTLSVYGDLFGNMAALAKAGGEKTFAVWKAFSIAQATIDSYRAYTAVLADPFFIGRPFLRQVAAASALAAGLAQVSSIASTSIGGGGGGSSAPTGASSVATQQEPERVVRISVQGESWMRDLVEGLATQLYEASEDGARVIVAR